MKRLVLTLAAIAFVAPTLSSCANTIRGVGRDASNTVNATQGAARRTGRAIAG